MAAPYDNDVVVSEPWWRRAIAPWALGEISNAQYYGCIRNVRVAGVGQQQGICFGLNAEPLVQLCVGVEVGMFDREHVSKLCRTTRSAHNLNRYIEALGGLRPAREYNGASLMGLIGDDAQLDELRRLIVPQRARILSGEQAEGHRIMNAMNAERTRLLAIFEEEERALLNQLRVVRGQRDAFLTGVNQIVPLNEYRTAGRSRLTQQQRQQYSVRWTELHVREGFAPLPDYLEEVRNLLNVRSQRRILSRFRDIGSENNASNRVREAYLQARGAQAPGVEAAPPNEEEPGEQVLQGGGV